MAWDWRTFLRETMDQQGLGVKDLSLAIGRGETYIRDILDGSKGKPPNDPGASSVTKIAQVLGVSVQKFMTGQEAETQRVTIVGMVTDDEHWAPLPTKRDPKQATEIDFRIEGGEPVALEVRGKGLDRAGYRHGDLLIGAKRVGTHADNLIGLECIVMTERGERYVMYLERGNVRGTFNLRPHYGGDEPILNQRIEWAAPIMWIRRGRH